MIVAPERVTSSGWRGAAVLTTISLICISVYWLGIGSSGLNQSEGQRAIPAWEMLDQGRWLPITLFDQLYIRKPPGVPWLIAASSAALGQTEFAARAVGASAATLACLLTAWFSRRWFGSWLAAALAAAAQALTPLFWAPGRSCEIEALNNVATQAAMLLAIDILVAQRSQSSWRALGLALAICSAALFKGPASAPCLIGVVCASVAVFRPSSPRAVVRALASRPLWLGIAAAGIATVAIIVLLARAATATGQDPVLQAPSRFLWSRDALAETILLLPAALLAALPFSLLTLIPWLRHHADHDHRPRRIARALSLTVLLSLAIYTVVGVSNVRYAMPALTAFFPILAWVAARHKLAWQSGNLRTLHRALLTATFLALLIFAAIFIPLEERRRARNSGRDAGLRLAEALGPMLRASGQTSIELHGDQFIDTRPETLWYARRALSQQGLELRVRWTPSRHRSPLPPPGALLILRTDGADEYVDEFAEYTAAGRLDALEVLLEDGVHRSRGSFKFRYRVFRVNE